MVMAVDMEVAMEVVMEAMEAMEAMEVVMVAMEKAAMEAVDMVEDMVTIKFHHFSLFLISK